MARYILSNETEIDIKKIYKYGVDEHGKASAEKYQESLGKKIQYLTEYPLACPEREEFTPLVRINHHRRHLIIYTAEGDHIFIIRILGDRMDVSKNLSN